MEPEPSNYFFALTENIDYLLILSIVSLLILLILSAFISGAEVAFFSLSHNDLKEISEAKTLRFKIVKDLLKRPKKLLATILISNNFINILIVLIFAYVGEMTLDNITPYLLRFLIEVVLVTFLILLFGEVLPKIYASRNPLKFSKSMAYPVKVLSTLLTFVSLPLLNLTKFIENKLSKKKSNISVEKLSWALELTSNEGTGKDERKILKGIVSFGNTDTSQIMIPRIDIFALSIEEKFDQILLKILEKGYSRIPVYKENIDEIVGVLYSKDLLPHLNKKDYEWQKLIRSPFFVPENKKLDDLLKEFQEKKNHLAIVVDEYGGTSGLVSLEDVIEEIVGEISDEFDDEDISYSKIDNKNFLFEGKTNLKDFLKIIETNEVELFEQHKGESETLGGFILEVYGKFPQKEKVITFYNYNFKIIEVDAKRIIQVKVTIN